MSSTSVPNPLGDCAASLGGALAQSRQSTARRRPLCNRGARRSAVARSRTTRPVPSGALKQLPLFDTAPVAMPVRRPLEGTPPPPKGDRRWLASFLLPEVYDLVADPPPAARTRRTRRRPPRTLAELYAAATGP